MNAERDARSCVVSGTPLPHRQSTRARGYRATRVPSQTTVVADRSERRLSPACYTLVDHKMVTIAIRVGLLGTTEGPDEYPEVVLEVREVGARDTRRGSANFI